MEKFMKKLYPILFLAFFIASCGEESFAPKSQYDAQVSNPISISNTNSCSAFTHIKPKVDFLFLWDNSTSATFINSATKTALNNLVHSVSDRFDYHIMLAPLVKRSYDPVNYQARIVTENTDGLSSDALSMRIDMTYADDHLDTLSYSSGSQESGISRSIDIIKANHTNGVFRRNSYVYVVVMSNQDDSSWKKQQVSSIDQENYLREELNEWLCLRGAYNPPSGSSCTGFRLDSLEMRFMNISAFVPKVGSNTCGSVASWEQGGTYQMFSERVYNSNYIESGNSIKRHYGQEGRAKRDSYNLCDQSNYTQIFDGINSSIEDTLIRHKYNYWPVASTGSAAIDPNEVRVFKNGVEQPRLSNPIPAGASGFTFTNSVQYVNTRYEPTPGEPFQGYVVRLYGSSIVTYPECIRVQTQTPKEYFGYVDLQTKPVESSIQLEINGVNIPQSSTNGWQLMKSGGQPQYFPNKNIKIQSPTNFSEATPAINKSGYFLKLNGSAVYSNGATIEVIYDPST